MEQELIKLGQEANKYLKELLRIQEEVHILVEQDEDLVDELFETSPVLKEIAEEFDKYAEQINI